MKIDIPDFSGVRVLVIGDLMLDRYWYGGTSRISPEAPVPVVSVKSVEERPGGAGNVALNIADLGGGVDLIGLIGQDEQGAMLQEKLRERRVNCLMVSARQHATVTKLRIISRQQQLIRLDFEDGFAGADHKKMKDAYNRALRAAQVVILSDYGKGTLADAPQLIAWAREHDKIVLVDPKGRDFMRYRQASLLTPNQSEFEAVVGPCRDETEMAEKGNALIKTLKLGALLITRSEKGMTLLRQGQEPLHFPARAREVYDVTGAGDTVIAVIAAGLAAGLALPDAIAISNLAAGIVVGKLGTATVTAEELEDAMLEHAHAGRGVMTEKELAKLLAQARAQGERIVMTNGCFDILHAGHVTYLQQAAKLGDRLVVAVNDDASVKRLKGKDRPVNSLQSRMTVLAALESVDWVVSFSEDTPERLIAKLSPDVLVKGGDYKPDEIAG
ncbi:MAG TPA: bifunctional D-glycero-beta-D-manno-heptose-7-phosphate kinase/D-glycero-beta-D-manno-heptose 1-phosphate adenylyltransferase HldE, partial [Gammaproteobacteria bacterium]|nr:bifunctional D-glycero-beta-D-manno-heptose-7-phosphate kinase/D-glycero-beta-D-manno-heptose 1-phosphate adenylyltransferase HldE [Gammaproteobacteria bacterium]